MMREIHSRSAIAALTCLAAGAHARRVRVRVCSVIRTTLLVCLPALLIGCVPAEPPPAEEQSEPTAGRSTTTTPEAVYHTALTFVGLGPEPSLVHLRFENRTEPNTLRLQYDGWIPGPDEWTSVLGVVDSIPVPRAAWRVLPAGPLRVGVENGGELSSLRLDLEGGPVRIDALEEVSTWRLARGL